MKYLIITLVLLLMSVAQVSAQSPIRPGNSDCPMLLAQAESDSAHQAGDMSSQGMPERPRFGHGPKRFERLRMNKLVEFLGLEGEDRETFVAASEKFGDSRMELDRLHRLTLDSLARGLREGGLSNEDIDRLVEKLDALEMKRQAVRREFREEIKPLLEPEQYGKLVVFEYRFEAQILDRLNEFRRRGGPPPFDEARRQHKRTRDLDDDSI